MNADERRSEGFRASTILRSYAVTLLFVGLAPGWQVFLLAEDACPIQPDYTQAFLDVHQGEPNLPTQFGGLPVLGPRAGDPNVWEVPCGAQRFSYRWCDPEGQQISGEVVAADLVAEFTCSADGVATLTVPAVTPEWHVVHVRLTDVPPP